jgi:ATP-dependent DNA ligase
MPARSAYVLYVDHTRGGGRRLYDLACELDLEGIVAKRADSPYTDNANERHWIEIKNSGYSQKEGRADLLNALYDGGLVLRRRAASRRRN